MEKTNIIKDRIHLITLLVKTNLDIPNVRSKAKLLAQTSYFHKLKVVEISTAASELARSILSFSKTGKITLYFVCSQENMGGICIDAQGKHPCYTRNTNNQTCFINIHALKSQHPFPALNKLFDYMEILGGFGGTPLRIKGIKFSNTVTWEELQRREKEIRTEIFPKDANYYIENLRMKHEEVLQLLKEKTQQNNRLERMNKELLTLTKDLEAMAKERTLAEVALKIADKVRNPATSIGGLAKSLLKKTDPSDPTAKKIQAIYKEAVTLEKIVKNFEQLAGMNVQHFIQEDLNLLVKDVVQNLLPSLEGKRGIKINVDIPSSPILVKANRKFLKIALLHVLRNALDVSPPGEKILVQVLRGENGPEIRVIDQGKGMSEKVKKVISGDQPVTSGSGLGLSLVRQILSEHQGTLKIRKQPLGGTAVIFAFPNRWKEQF